MRIRTYFVASVLVCSLSVFAGCGAGRVVNKAADSSATPEELLSLATKGDAHSQTALGVMYAYGKGVQQDDKQALFWFRKAAEQGNARAQRDLAVMYSTGKGVSRDDTEADKWFRLAANQGNAYAQDNLASMFLLARGVPQDDTEAARWSVLLRTRGMRMLNASLG
jgi:TPR repeat protein